MRRIDLDAAMAQSANIDAPVVGAPTASNTTTTHALSQVVADLEVAARQGASLVSAVNQRLTSGYSAHRQATATLVQIDADNAQSLTAVGHL
ncbi:hypothetical protein ACGFK1_08305 [Mycobacterium sp. NPDC048908]|uniref:hypothetical protein n=1 Tax=Mycobacterium sp. NPDC048908 TaxID=3364292 RepID=UPI003711528B